MPPGEEIDAYQANLVTAVPRGAAPAGALATAAAVTTVCVLPVFLTGAVAVQLREDLHFDESDLGLTVAVFFGSAALLSAVGGHLAERIGPVAAMRVGAGAAAAVSLAIAVLAHDLRALLLCLIVGGAANAIGQPSSNLYLARRVALDRLGLAFGLKQGAIPLATLLGGAMVPAVALTVGWRWAYVGAAGLAVIVALSVRGGEYEHARRRGGRPEGVDAALRSLVLLGLGAALGSAAVTGLGGFLVSATVEAGVAEGTAGLLAALCSGVGVASRLVLGVRADRRGGRHLVTVVVLLGSGSLTYLLLATGQPVAMVVGGLGGYAIAWSWPGLFNLAIVRDNPGAPGAATGITQSGIFCGGVVGPLLFGYVVDHWSYRAAWSMSAVISAAATVAVWLGRRAMITDRVRRGL